MKKLFKLLLVSALVVSFVGCDSNTPKPTNTPGSEEESGLVWSNWSGAEEGSIESIKFLVDEWNKGADELDKVEQINWPWGDTTTQAALRARGTEKYDIAQLDIRMLPALAEAGILADLSEIFPANFFTDNFDTGTASVGQYKGVQYGVPWTVAPMAMIANPTILKDSGVDFSVATIADFEKACDMVLKNHPDNLDGDKTNDIIPYAVMNKDDGTATPDFMAWLWTFGGELFDKDGNITINSQASIDAFNFFKSIHDKGYSNPAMARGDARTLFSEGRVAFYDDALMSKGSIWNESIGPIEGPALPMARPVLKEGDSPKAVGWGHVLVVLNNSNKKDDAANFISHLISEEMALSYFKSNGLLPSKLEVLNSDEVQNDYWSKSWVPVLNGGRLTETAGTKEAAYNAVINQSLQGLISGDKTPEQAVADIESGIKNS